MLASVLIIAFSFVLLIYWFRYTCILLLTATRNADYAAKVAAVNHLNFVSIHSMLQNHPDESELERLRNLVEADYRIVRYLFCHAAGFGERSFDQTLLAVDFKLMRLWYRVARRFSTVRALRALQEMSNILVYFADQMGRRPAYSLPV